MITCDHALMTHDHLVNALSRVILHDHAWSCHFVQFRRANHADPHRSISKCNISSSKVFIITCMHPHCPLHGIICSMPSMLYMLSMPSMLHILLTSLVSYSPVLYLVQNWLWHAWWVCGGPAVKTYKDDYFTWQDLTTNSLLAEACRLHCMSLDMSIPR